MSSDLHDEPSLRLLTELERSVPATQRSLARNVGIALGLTNLLVRRFVAKGWVRVTGIRPHRVRYLLTPAGLAEKARLSQAALQNAIERYRIVRERVSAAFARLDDDWPAEAGPRRIGFLGSGEIAEIGFICLQETRLTLAAVIDDQGKSRFLDLPTTPLDTVGRSGQLDEVPCVIVMALSPSAAHDRAIETLRRMGRRIVRL